MPEPRQGWTKSVGEGTRSDRLGDLLSAYMDRINAGWTIDEREIARDHPDLAAEILSDLRALMQVGSHREGAEALGSLGDFQLRRQVGRGGMGVVYEAWQQSMDRRVALKVLPAGVAADTKTLARFLREAKIAGKLDHPNIVRVHGMGVDRDTPHYAMDFVEGETLAQVLARRRGAREAPAPEECYRLSEAFAAAAEGLQHAHREGVIHRDLKPSNLILDPAGRLRILDFGLARLEGQASLTQSGDFMGTILYMSPEQAMAKRIQVDHRTDIYSFGATLYEMLTLRPPFEGKSTQDTLSRIIFQDPVPPRRVNPRVPADLETIVLKCLRKDPQDRYGTAEALAQDLRRFVRGDAIEARPPTPWDLFARRVSRHRRKLLAAAGVSALLLVCGALAWRLRLEQETSRLYLAQDYEKRVVAAAMKLLRAERVLATRSRDFSEKANILSRRYQSLLSGSGKLVAEEAVAEFSRAIADLPERFEGYHYRAKGRQLLDNDAGAIEDIRECLRRNPTFMPAKALLADLEGARDEPGRAPRTSSSPVPDRGDRWGGAWLRAHQAMNEEAWKKAADAYSELLALEEEAKGELFLGSSIENLIGRGVARMETRDFEGAKFDFWAARTISRKLWGEFLEPLLLLGKAYVLEGNPSRAEEFFREALDRSGDREKMSLWVAAAYQSLLLDLEQSGRLEEAVAAARKAVQFHAEERRATPTGMGAPAGRLVEETRES